MVVTPFGLGGGLRVLGNPGLSLAAAGVGVCSSVIPYVTDQLAMARLPRASFALMLALLPMFATVIGAIVLRQFPTRQDLLGIGLVIAGVAVHKVPEPMETAGTTRRLSRRPWRRCTTWSGRGGHRPIVGATRLAHLDDAIAAESLTLDDTEVARLEAPYRPHRILGHS